MGQTLVMPFDASKLKKFGSAEVLWFACLLALADATQCIDLLAVVCDTN